jgi:hypothetical protein
MMFTDPVMESWLHPSKGMLYAVEVSFAVGVIVVGKLWVRWMVSTEGEKHVNHDRIESELGLRKGE